MPPHLITQICGSVVLLAQGVLVDLEGFRVRPEGLVHFPSRNLKVPQRIHDVSSPSLLLAQSWFSYTRWGKGEGENGLALSIRLPETPVRGAVHDGVDDSLSLIEFPLPDQAEREISTLVSINTRGIARLSTMSLT